MQLSEKQAIVLFSQNDKLYGDIFVEVDGEIVRQKQKLPVSEITDETLAELKDTFHPESIKIKTYNKNGTSWRFQNEIDINFGKTARKTSAINGFDDEDEEDFENEVSRTPAPRFTAPAVSLPENGTLGLYQWIATEKSKEVQELKDRNERLSRENDSNKKKIDRLETQIHRKDMEHEMALERKESEKNNSLSGILEQAAKPEIMGALPGIITALKGMAAPGLAAAPDPLSGIQDDGHRSALKEINTFLATSPDMTAKTYAIVLKAAKHPGLIDRILKSTEKFD